MPLMIVVVVVAMGLRLRGCIFVGFNFGGSGGGDGDGGSRGASRRVMLESRSVNGDDLEALDMRDELVRCSSSDLCYVLKVMKKLVLCNASERMEPSFVFVLLIGLR